MIFATRSVEPVAEKYTTNTFFFADFFVTATLHFSLVFPICAVIVAFPAFLAVTFPFLLTAATDFLLEDQVTVFDLQLF